MKHLIPLILLVLASCAPEPLAEHMKIEGFERHVRKFKFQAQIRGRKLDLNGLTIQYGPIDKANVVGQCQMPSKIVTIKEEYYKTLKTLQQEVLIFHELGHCILDRDHVELLNEDGPISVMFPQLISREHYRKHRKELLDELFSN